MRFELKTFPLEKEALKHALFRAAPSAVSRGDRRSAYPLFEKLDDRAVRQIIVKFPAIFAVYRVFRADDAQALIEHAVNACFGALDVDLHVNSPFWQYCLTPASCEAGYRLGLMGYSDLGV